MSRYKPSKLMERHLAAVEKDPSKALELSAPLRRELEGLTGADLAEMSQAVKFSKGRPIHLTDEQNEAFKAENRHRPSFSSASEAAAAAPAPAQKVPRAPAGKFGGPVGGQSDENSMSDAWAKFGGSFEAFKEEVFKPVPADLRVGKQEWLVQGVVHQPGGGVGLLNCGSFQEAEAAMGHAERMQAWRPYFDFNVVSQWGWVAYPMDEDTARGVQRTYKDKNLDAIMRDHFANSSRVTERQAREMKEVEANRGPRAETGAEPEFPPTQILTDMIDDGAGIDEVVDLPV